MNEQRLAASLRAIHTDPSCSPGADAVYQHVLSIPIEQTPQQRTWRPPFPTWRFPTMFSALKFVAAGVIVALFGGFLLAGILTTGQGDESVPAAVPASSTGALASCPPGSRPDQPGPVDQPRPPGGEAVNAAFDRAAGKVVYITEVEGIHETWLFDVCTNTWSLAQQGADPDMQLPFGAAIYDPVAGLTILVTDYDLWTYDLPSNTWAKRQAPPLSRSLRLAYDTGVGRVVALSLVPPNPMWGYDPVADRWDPIEQEGAAAATRLHTLFTYDGSVDRLFAYGLWEGGELFDEETGTWEPTGAESPSFEYGGYVCWGGEIAYDEAAGLTVLSSGGHVIAYDAAADRWETLFDPVADDGSTEVSLASVLGMHHRLLYDPLNERIVMVGGDVRDPEVDWAPRDDVWAFDTRTREWIELVPSKDSAAR